MSELEYARTLLERGDKESAANELGRILHVNPSDIEVWLLLAQSVDDNNKKKDCYLQVLNIQPNNQIALVGLRRLENIIEESVNYPQTNSRDDPYLSRTQISSRESLPESIMSEDHMLQLNCPSCGGHLELPENMSVAHCMYCGTKIFLSDSTSAREQQNLKRNVELCKTALGAKNYDESLRYCNNILEIDPNNAEAWIDCVIRSKASTDSGASRPLNPEHVVH